MVKQKDKELHEPDDENEVYFICKIMGMLNCDFNACKNAKHVKNDANSTNFTSTPFQLSLCRITQLGRRKGGLHV